MSTINCVIVRDTAKLAARRSRRQVKIAGVCLVVHDEANDMPVRLRPRESLLFNFKLESAGCDRKTKNGCSPA